MSNQIFNQAFNQGIGAYVNCLNNLRIQDLHNAMKIIEDEARRVILNKDNASKILNYTRDNIEDVILKKRGGENGGHGFIAEFAEAGIVNARRAIEGLNPIVKVLNDNGPADLLIGRNTIQMKFYNNLRDELDQSFSFLNCNETIELVHHVNYHKTSFEWYFYQLINRQVHYHSILLQ